VRESIKVVKKTPELFTYLSELGQEGRLIRLQMQELLFEMEREALLVIKDYSAEPEVKADVVMARFQELSRAGVIEDSTILKLLGHQGYVHMDEFICPRGYRMLNKIPRLPMIIIENLIKRFGKFTNMIAASVEELDDVEGIGEVRARKIKEGFKLIRDQLMADRQM
jgi:diadenylate cyclase